MNYLLDTDIVSAHLKSRGTVADRVVQHVGSLYVSVVCVGELKTWTRRRRASPQRDVDLDLFLRNVVVLPVTYEIACRFGDLRAELLDRGRPTPRADLFIAATALVHDLTLITHNVKDFQHIPDLLIEDWLAD